MNKVLDILYLQPKKNKIIYLFLGFIFLFIGGSYYLKIYDSYKTMGIITCDGDCKIEIDIPVESADILNQEPLLYYHNKTYKIDKVLTKDVFLQDGKAFLKVEIKSNIKLKKANFIELRLNYNEQRIINKIWNILIGKD